ncbi:MAG: 1-deoxy-D-xylulose-5-phosphate synthase [Candidatus Staskawiczbacteria bacterium]|nr:1-deoxy-D-xylulose-5-phosphate synthase [Candidatus Staskawiczbacteria bacterium]
MRKEFIETLITLAEKDKNIYLLNGDLGFSFLEEFEKRFPERYVNCGIAEQNMMGVAAGMAMEGKKVYVYSIIPFAVFRCFEQIRNDIAYHNLDVTIVGAGVGFAYGTHGATHFAVEDIAVLRVLPNLTIISPADPIEMAQLTLQSGQTKNPTYIRLDKNTKKLHQPDDKIVMGKPSILKNGKDGVIITIGSYLDIMINVQKRLAEKNHHLKLLHLHTIKPIDEEALLKEINGQKIVFTAEEHKLIGGVGTIIGEILLRNNINNITLKSIGVSEGYPPVIGQQDYMRKYYNIDEDSVYKKILTELEKL